MQTRGPKLSEGPIVSSASRGGRWQNVFLPRMKAALQNWERELPAVYPGISPALTMLGQGVSASLGAGSEHFHFDQFLKISAYPSARPVSSRPLLHDDSWAWHFIPQPQLRELLMEQSDGCNRNKHVSESHKCM